MGILDTGKRESVWSGHSVPTPLAKLYITFDHWPFLSLTIASAANSRKSSRTSICTASLQYLEKIIDKECRSVPHEGAGVVVQCTSTSKVIKVSIWTARHLLLDVSV